MGLLQPWSNLKREITNSLGPLYFRIFLEQLEGRGVIREYDEELWYATVDMVEVHAGKKMVFIFRDGRREATMPEDWE